VGFLGSLGFMSLVDISRQDTIFLSCSFYLK
jgi:hypothetical protein